MVKLFNQDEASNWLQSARTVRRRTELWIASPFVTKAGLMEVEGFLRSSRAKTVRLLTNVEPLQIALGTLDVDAIADLVLRFPGRFQVFDVTRLHAKVFLLVGHSAVVGSSNLTKGGLDRNLELGYMTTNTGDLSNLRRYLEVWSGASSALTASELHAFSRIAEERFGHLADVLRSRPTSLPAFPADKETYVEVVRDIIARIPPSGMPERDFLSLLVSRRSSLRQDRDGPLRRHLFLQRVGLVEVASEVVRRGPLALKMNRRDAAAWLAEAVQDCYPAVKRLVEMTASGEVWSQAAMRAELRQRGDLELLECFETCLRWAVSLGLIHVPKRGGSAKQIRRFCLNNPGKRAKRSPRPVSSSRSKAAPVEPELS